MPQSLAQIYMHLIFSTKNRLPLLRPEIREDMQAYLGGVLRALKSPPIAVQCVGDHAHLLYLHSKNLSPEKLVEEVKTGGSKWIKIKGAEYRQFHWQRGYGLFSVSASRTDAVVRYIRNQEKHHHRATFQDEFREFLKKYKIEYDERYVWD